MKKGASSAVITGQSHADQISSTGWFMPAPRWPVQVTCTAYSC